MDPKPYSRSFVAAAGVRKLCGKVWWNFFPLPPYPLSFIGRLDLLAGPEKRSKNGFDGQETTGTIDRQTAPERD